MRVIHVAPTGFGRDGLFGGGERYPLELGRALSEHVACELITFGRIPGTTTTAGSGSESCARARTLGAHPARPVVPHLPRRLASVDVVHVHQMRGPSSVLAAMTARTRGIPTAVTDHGLQAGRWSRLVPHLFDRS